RREVTAVNGVDRRAAYGAAWPLLANGFFPKRPDSSAQGNESPNFAALRFIVRIPTRRFPGQVQLPLSGNASTEPKPGYTRDAPAANQGFHNQQLCDGAYDFVCDPLLS